MKEILYDSLQEWLQAFGRAKGRETREADVIPRKLLGWVDLTEREHHLLPLGPAKRDLALLSPEIQQALSWVTTKTGRRHRFRQFPPELEES